MIRCLISSLHSYICCESSCSLTVGFRMCSSVYFCNGGLYVHWPVIAQCSMESEAFKHRGSLYTIALSTRFLFTNTCLGFINAGLAKAIYLLISVVLYDIKI